VWAPPAYHPICLAHHLRDLEDALEADDQAGVVWSVALQRVFRRAIHLHREWDQVPPGSFVQRRTRIRNAAERLIFRGWAGAGAAGNLQWRYLKHGDDLQYYSHNM
jgi:hypothetical protein